MENRCSCHHGKYVPQGCSGYGTKNERGNEERLSNDYCSVGAFSFLLNLFTNKILIFLLILGRGTSLTCLHSQCTHLVKSLHNLLLSCFFCT